MKNFESAAWVASPRIERGSRASETLILSIVLRGQNQIRQKSIYFFLFDQSMCIGGKYFYRNGEQNYAKKLAHCNHSTRAKYSFYKL